LIYWGGGRHNHWITPPRSILDGDFPQNHTIERLTFIDSVISPSFMETVFPRFHKLKLFKCIQVGSVELDTVKWSSTFLDSAGCRQFLANSGGSLEEIIISDSMSRKNELHHRYYPSGLPYSSWVPRSLSPFRNLKHISAHITMLAGRGTAEVRPQFTPAQSWDFAQNLPSTLETLRITNDMEHIGACLGNLFLNPPIRLRMVRVSLYVHKQ